MHTLYYCVLYVGIIHIFLQWLPIDPCSRDSPLHTDISRERELAQGDVIGLSTWDQMENLGYTHTTYIELVSVP